jgi:hypothetical protein
MKAKPVRIVLAFYPSEKGPTDQVWKSLRETAQVYIIRPDSANIPASCRSYALLRLEGEALVVAQTHPSNVEGIVQTCGWLDRLPFS